MDVDVVAASQALIAYVQKCCMIAGADGPLISTCVSRIVMSPVDAVMCAAVPVPPTQP